MEYVKEIAFFKNRRDEVPNQELAALLADKEDVQGVKEIAGYLNDKNKSVQSDCLKVLYEIGYNKPELIVDYFDQFLYHLNNRNNRMVWGSMIALANIAALVPQKIMDNFDLIQKKTDEGSLITHVWGIYVMINCCKGKKHFKEKLYPLLLDYCRKCRPIDFAKRVESVLTITDPDELDSINAIIENKKESLSESQYKRVKKAIKKYDT